LVIECMDVMNQIITKTQAVVWVFFTLARR